MFTKRRIMATMCTSRMTGNGIQMVFGLSSAVWFSCESGQIQSIHWIFHQTRDLGSVAFLREPLQMDHEVFGKAFNSEKLGAALFAFAFSTNLHQSKVRNMFISSGIDFPILTYRQPLFSIFSFKNFGLIWLLNGSINSVLVFWEK